MTEIHLFPPRTVPEALTTGFLGMAVKALSALILGFTLAVSLIGLVFACINIFSQEEIFHVLQENPAFFLLSETTITEDELNIVLFIILGGIIIFPLCYDILLFHLKRRDRREKTKDEFLRRLRRNSFLIVMIYVFAIATAPVARYAEESNALSVSAALAGFCLAALIANAIFVALDTLANQLLWHAGVVLYKKFC